MSHQETLDKLHSVGGFGGVSPSNEEQICDAVWTLRPAVPSASWNATQML